MPEAFDCELSSYYKRMQLEEEAEDAGYDDPIEYEYDKEHREREKE